MTLSNKQYQLLKAILEWQYPRIHILDLPKVVNDDHRTINLSIEQGLIEEKDDVPRWFCLTKQGREIAEKLFTETYNGAIIHYLHRDVGDASRYIIFVDDLVTPYQLEVCKVGDFWHQNPCTFSYLKNERNRERIHIVRENVSITVTWTDSDMVDIVSIHVEFTV